MLCIIYCIAKKEFKVMCRFVCVWSPCVYSIAVSTQAKENEVGVLVCHVSCSVVDNRSLKPRQRNQVDIGGFMGDSPRDRPHMSSQQRLAVYQFLSSSMC